MSVGSILTLPLRLDFFQAIQEVWYDNPMCVRYILTRYEESPTVENVDCAGRSDI